VVVVRFFDVVVFVWRYWRQSPLLLAGTLVGMLAATLCDVFMPVLGGRLIDSLAGDGSPRADALRPALWALAGFVGLAVAAHVFRNACFRLWLHLATRIMPRIVSDTFSRVQQFSTDWHVNSFAGATVRKITRGMRAYDLLADTIYLGLLPAGVVLLGVTAVMAWHWPLMGPYVLGASLTYAGVSVVLSRSYIAPANVVLNQTDSMLGAALADAMTCNAAVKAFGAERREDARLRGVAERWRATALHAWTREVNVGIAQSSMSVLLQLGLLGLALWFWAHGRASPGDVAYVMTSYFLVNGYLREIGRHVRNLQQSVNELDDVVHFHHMPLGLEDAPGARPLRAIRGEIAFDAVTFRYGNQPRPLYEDFGLRIVPGEKVALVGHSGSGKSTFVKLVQRLYDLDGGRILIDGQDIARVTQESVRRAISLVPQEPLLFHRSLAENIAYARPEASREEVVRAASQAHAHEFIERLAQGYETMVGERGVKLSGGERQRVALARAFLADSPILILDEATSSLDSVTEALIQSAIAELIRGRTTIIIAHRLSTIRRVDRILVFRDGAIVEQGTHAEMLKRAQSYYRELHAIQLQSLVE
jgi:ATP-binding cassette subfamily B protein